MTSRHIVTYSDHPRVIPRGDEATWSLADWHWDSQAFTALPKHDISAATAPCRAPKRQKTQDIAPCEAVQGEQPPMATYASN